MRSEVKYCYTRYWFASYQNEQLTLVHGLPMTENKMRCHVAIALTIYCTVEYDQKQKHISFTSHIYPYTLASKKLFYTNQNILIVIGKTLKSLIRVAKVSSFTRHKTVFFYRRSSEVMFLRKYILLKLRILGTKSPPNP